jgi:UTP--glucose-1-phosphate uridylyltransferase
MVRKAVIPIAGLGTRMLPLTKVVPKALLPVWNKPVIHWIMEELVASGIEEVIFVYSRGQEMVKNYFGSIEWLEAELKERGKDKQLQELLDLQRLAKFSFVEQKEQLGDGHAVLQAKDFVGEEPFLVVFGDCLWQSIDPSVAVPAISPLGRGEDYNSVTGHMLRFFENHLGSIVGLSRVSEEEVYKYGIVELDEGGVVERMVEKPEIGSTESDLAIVGRYVFTSDIWSHLEKGIAESGEKRLIDALLALQKDGDAVYGLELEGRWLDCGSVEGLYSATDVMRNC